MGDEGQDAMVGLSPAQAQARAGALGVRATIVRTGDPADALGGPEMVLAVRTDDAGALVFVVGATRAEVGMVASEARP